MAGGTGNKFANVITVVAGVASLAATLTSVVSIIFQAKNYRKPLLQRYVVRILLMVPIYSIASWTSMVSLNAASFLDPVRDIYEAFTIYTFFQLLINYLGGERSLIIMTHGRAPVQHLWPLNHVLPKVDISDPHTFLSIKRAILQYAWLKPILAFSAIIMKATGTYKEGYIGIDSGYLWSGIIYNISVTLSLYGLGLFWVCMHQDLQPFRPVPKFLCIKLIIFASYWQGFLLSILVFLGAIPDDVPEYTPDNLAAAIQDALICIEMPIFAAAHWYAFSWHDFADNNISSARMPINYAFRDAFGVRDLVEDSKETFRGDNYGYRVFDSGDKVMAHEDSKSRLARLREGMRYERGGKGKYWIPKPGEVNSTTPLLGSGTNSAAAGSSRDRPDQINENAHAGFDEPELDAEDDGLFEAARDLEYGDWNYPVITANEPLRERYLSSAGNFGVRSPKYPSPQPRATRPSAGSRSTTSQSTHRAPDPDAVVPVKKKKKGKKAVHHHPAPNVAKLDLEAGPPPPNQAAALQTTIIEASPPKHQAAETLENPPSPGHDQSPGIESPWSDEPRDRNHEAGSRHDYLSGYQAPDTEEFQNHWATEETSK